MQSKGKEMFTRLYKGMKLVAANNQTTTFSNLTLFHGALHDVEFIIDDSPAANFKTNFAYGDWLSAGGLNPNTNTYAFLTSQSVYRTDKLISKTGFSGKCLFWKRR